MPRPTLDDTRASLLAAGERLVRARARQRSAAVDGALGHLKAGDVAREAGLSKGMIYHLWPSQEEYRRDLLLHLARATTTESYVATEAPDVVATYADADDAIAGVATATLGRALSDEQWFMFMEVSSFVANDAVRHEMAGGQSDALEATARFFEAGLAIWGRRLRDGYSAEDLVLLTRAFSRGVTVQAKVDPGPLFDERPWRGDRARNLYEVGVLALFDALIEPA